ncbi:MAG: HAD family phosphatase [Lentimicrobiaceae bacterium]|jgi:beta-phosphoglucomutase family hydrolase
MVLIFDMDGVIVDNYSWHLNAFVEFGKKHGLKITKEEFSKYFGSTNHLIMNSLFNKNLTKDEITALAEEKETIYRELYRPFIKPVEGLPAFLKYAFSQGIAIALATSAPHENVNFTLEATGLKKYFNVITDSSMVKHGKPDPEIYLLTAAKLGVPPSECIVFEDSVPGILSAQQAGMQVIGVATTHKPDELLMYVKEIILNFKTVEKLISKWS